MSTCIELRDGQIWWAANWAYDSVILRIADQLDGSDVERELATLLRDQTCAKQGPGVGMIDLRLLSTEHFDLFRVAAAHAVESARVAGPCGWHDPSAFPKWLERFEELVQMMHPPKDGSS